VFILDDARVDGGADLPRPAQVDVLATLIAVDLSGPIGSG
jgi:hypothetical protein